MSIDHPATGSLVNGEQTTSALSKPVNSEMQAVDTDDEIEHRKLARKLWTWYRQIDMQLVSHIGSEETDQCWKMLGNAKSLQDLINNPELFNLLASVHQQYLSGFTGKAQR